MGPALSVELRPADLDIDVGGLLRIRLIGAGERQTKRIARQFGSAPATPSGDPDLVFRYVDRVGGPRLRLIGLHDAAWDDDGFYLLARAGRHDARARIPFQTLGSGSEVLLETDFPGAPPLLVPLVNLLMLERGVLSLHASAVELDGRGVAAAGWSKGGKTEAMLALVQRGARMVADEWTYIDPETRIMRGAPGLVRLQDWHLDQLPDLRARLTPSSMAGMRTAQRVAAVHRLLSRPLDALPGGHHVGRAVRLLDEQRHVDVAPDIVSARPTADRQALHTLLWVVACPGPRTEVSITDPAGVASRMIFSHQHHRRSLIAAYHQYRFAFPDVPNELIDTLEDRERQLLETALASIPAYLVLHGTRPDIRDLGDAISRAIG